MYFQCIAASASGVGVYARQTIGIVAGLRRGVPQQHDCLARSGSVMGTSQITPVSSPRPDPEFGM